MHAPLVPTLAVFLVSWLLITGRRLRLLPLGRPAGALAGAVAMVAIGALTPQQAYAAVDGDTIVLLLGMMLITAYLEKAGAIDRVATWLMSGRHSGFAVLGLVSGLSAVASALIVNDTVCLFLTPVVAALCAKARLPFAPFLLILATSANLGSAATLVGNPQNMIIGAMSGIPYLTFAAVVAPAAAAALLANLGLAWLYFGRDLPATIDADPPPKTPIVGGGALAVVLVAVTVGFLAGGHLGFTALGGAVALMIAEREEPREVMEKVDWSLLAFFASLFVVVAGLERTGLVDAAWVAVAPHLSTTEPSGVALFTAAVVVGSNLVSNVPLVMLVGPRVPSLGDPLLVWSLLGFISTVAGNLTLIGSVANLIVAERARAHYVLGFWEYLRFGAVSTLVSLTVGVPLVWAAATWGRPLLP